MRLGDETKNRAKRRAARNAENVRIRERIAEQSLKAGTGNGERGANENGQDDPRQANVLNNQPVVAGDLAALAEDHPQQVTTQSVERNRDGAELQGDHYNEEQDDKKQKAMEHELSKRQRLHAQPPVALGCSRNRIAVARDERDGDCDRYEEFSFSTFAFAPPGFSAKASGCN